MVSCGTPRVLVQCFHFRGQINGELTVSKRGINGVLEPIESFCIDVTTEIEEGVGELVNEECVAITVDMGTTLVSTYPAIKSEVEI